MKAKGILLIKNFIIVLATGVSAYASPCVQTSEGGVASDRVFAIQETKNIANKIIGPASRRAMGSCRLETKKELSKLCRIRIKTSKTIKEVSSGDEGILNGSFPREKGGAYLNRIAQRERSHLIRSTNSSLNNSSSSIVKVLGEVVPNSAKYVVSVSVAKDAVSRMVQDEQMGSASGSTGKKEGKYSFELMSCNKSQLTPDDENFPILWGMQEYDGQTKWGAEVSRAWDRYYPDTKSKVLIFVTDTGVDFRHPDLAQNMWVNPREIAENGIDDDANGVIDDIHGFDAIMKTGDPIDRFGHGTHVAGTIGAIGNNQIGVAGVNFKASIVAVKLLSDMGYGVGDGILSGFRYVLNVARANPSMRVVVNASWGGGTPSSLENQMLQEFLENGIIFVAAAGNNNAPGPIWPARDPSSIAVGATNKLGVMASFSNYGESVDIAAPGQDIASTWPGGDYKRASGTSMASPHVAGIVGLMLGQNPSLNLSQIKGRLKQTSNPISPQSEKKVNSDSGIIDANELLSGIQDGTPTSTPTFTPTAGDGGSATPTPTSTQTATPTRTTTPRASATPTRTPTGTVTSVPTATPTLSVSSTPTRTATFTATFTPAGTRTPTPSATYTRTSVPTPTSTPTRIATNTNTPTPNPTRTQTPTRTHTRTPTSTPTATPTNSVEVEFIGPTQGSSIQIGLTTGSIANIKCVRGPSAYIVACGRSRLDVLWRGNWTVVGETEAYRCSDDGRSCLINFWPVRGGFPAELVGQTVSIKARRQNLDGSWTSSSPIYVYVDDAG